MTFPLIDCGVNLTSKTFQGREEEVIREACTAGVEQLILIGSDIPDSEQAAALATQFAGCWSTSGIHPHQAKTFTQESLDRLHNLARLPVVKALGEMGLDFNRNYSPPAVQLTCFEAQLELGTQLQLPVYLHQRDAHAEFLALMKNFRSALDNAVLHCFTDERKALYDYLDLDLYIGITGWICDERRGQHLQALVKEIPADRLLLETDAPYLLPRTLRPRPKSGNNAPCYLPLVLQTVSQCLGKSEADVARQTTANARRFFSLP